MESIMRTENHRSRVGFFVLLAALLTFTNAYAQDSSGMVGFDTKLGLDAAQNTTEPKTDTISAASLWKTFKPSSTDHFNSKNSKTSVSPDGISKEGDSQSESDSDDPPGTPPSERFHWRPALVQSLTFLGAQHGFRMLQKKTTREFEGKFFNDWGKSIKNLTGWRDGDITFVNYVAHPMQGGLTGRIFVNNSDNAKKQQFGMSKEYWRSRGKAFVWSAVWSVQFEIGPLSESSLGNVGLHQRNGRRSTGYVDYVITPTVGTGWLVGEDAIDRYVLKGWIEKKANGSLTRKVKILRTFLTPTTSVANILRWRYPWKRDDR